MARGIQARLCHGSSSLEQAQSDTSERPNQIAPSEGAEAIPSNGPNHDHSITGDDSANLASSNANANSIRVLVLGAGELGRAILDALAQHPARRKRDSDSNTREDSALESQDEVPPSQLSPAPSQLQSQSQSQQEVGLELSVLLRPPPSSSSSSSISPARQALLDDLSQHSIGIIYCDLTSPDLYKSMENFDIVISATGFASNASNAAAPGEGQVQSQAQVQVQVQKHICEAALRAKVPWFIPWQFGVDYDIIGRGSSQPLFDEQLDVRDILREHVRDYVRIREQGNGRGQSESERESESESESEVGHEGERGVEAATASSGVDVNDNGNVNADGKAFAGSGTAGTRWTIISTGIFTSFLFDPFFGVVDVNTDTDTDSGTANSAGPEPGSTTNTDRDMVIVTVTALGDWENRVTMTSAKDIGRITAEVIYRYLQDQARGTSGSGSESRGNGRGLVHGESETRGSNDQAGPQGRGVESVADIANIVTSRHRLATDPVDSGIIYTAGDTVTFSQLADTLERLYSSPTDDLSTPSPSYKGAERQKVMIEKKLKTVQELQLALKENPQDVSLKYQLIWAVNKGVAWDKKASWNAQNGVEVEDMKDWVWDNLKL
jgi:hypothetical protein